MYRLGQRPGHRAESHDHTDREPASRPGGLTRTILHAQQESSPEDGEGRDEELAAEEEERPRGRGQPARDEARGAPETTPLGSDLGLRFI